MEQLSSTGVGTKNDSSAMMRTARLLAASVLTLFLQACGGAQTPAEQDAAFVESQVADANKSGSPSQQAVVADGEVNGAEYESQFDALRVCVQRGGGTFTDYGVSKFDGLTMDFDVSSKSLPPEQISSLRETCFGSELLYTEAIYKITHPNTLDPAILASAGDCLRKQGFAITGEERNLQQLGESVKPLSQTAVPVFQCVSAAAKKAYPREFKDRDISTGY